MKTFKILKNYFFSPRENLDSAQISVPLSSILYSKELMNNQKTELGKLAYETLHNIGNITTGLNMRFTEYPLSNTMQKMSELLNQISATLKIKADSDDIGTFLKEDEFGRNFVQALQEISQILNENSDLLRNDIHLIRNQVSNIGDIISSQQQKAHGGLNLMFDFDPAAIVKECLSILSDFISNEQIKISLNLAQGEIYLNRYGFSQLIMNLLVNAINSIVLRKKTDQIIGHIEIVLSFTNSDMTFLIKDNGMGFEHLNFSKVSAGHGLNNSNAFVNENSGAISISSPGRLSGATIVVSLPLNNENRRDISA